MENSVLILNIPLLTLKVGQRETSLSPGLFKVLYQLFQAASRGRSGELMPVAEYEKFPMTHGALKVQFVDIKQMLPEGSYENVRGKGYRPSGAWKWELIA